MRQDAPREGAVFEGFFGPLKSIGSICCGVSSKRDNLVVNNGMQQKVSFNPQ